MPETSEYTTAANVKLYLGISGTTWDTLFASLIKIASRMIDNYTGKRFYTTANNETRKYDGSGSEALYIDDLISLDSITLDDEALTADVDYLSYPANDSPKSELRKIQGDSDDDVAVWTEGQQNVVIVGKFGYCASADIPEEIEFACRELVADIFRNRRNGKVQSESAQGYNVSYGSIQALPEVVKNILQGYQDGLFIAETKSASDSYEITD